MQAKTAT